MPKTEWKTTWLGAITGAAAGVALNILCWWSYVFTGGRLDPSFGPVVVGTLASCAIAGAVFGGPAGAFIEEG